MEILAWRTFNTDAVDIVKDWELLCFAYKWWGSSKRYFLSRQKFDEKSLVNSLWDLFDEADIVIAHNGDHFDNKKAAAKFLQFRLKPHSPFVSVDTRKSAKRFFGFTSNRLDRLGERLGLGRKVQTGGIELWKGCQRNEEAAWRKMKRYNLQDIQLLENIYRLMKPWITDHPNMAPRGVTACRSCGGMRLKSYGWKHTNSYSYRRYRCLTCGAFTSESKRDREIPGSKIK